MFVCTEWTSLVGLLVTVGVSLAVGQDEVLLGPQKGLVVYVSMKGARIRMSRQLPPPITPSTLTSTLAAVTMGSTATPAPTSPATSGHVQTTGEILLYLAELREVDADGVKVKQSGNVGRAFSSFDGQVFNVTQDFNSVIPNFQPSIQADVLTLNLTLPKPLSGLFKILVSVTKANGSLNSGDEVMTLMEGQLEMSVEVDDWRWCDREKCSSSKPSMFIEMDVVVQLPPRRTARQADGQSYGRPKRYSLGKDAWTDFSTKVLLDGSWQNLTSGYSKLSTSDSKNILTVRLPRFNSSAIYNMAFDPGFQLADSTDGPVGCASAMGDIRVLWLAAVAMLANGLGLST